MNHPWKCFNTVIPFHRALLSANANIFDEKSEDRGNIVEKDSLVSIELSSIEIELNLSKLKESESLPGSLKNEGNGGFLKKKIDSSIGKDIFLTRRTKRSRQRFVSSIKCYSKYQDR